jgi:hypothetical protein
MSDRPLPHLAFIYVFILHMRQLDPRYNYIKLLLTDGKIQSFLDIFDHIPKTIVANDLGKNVARFTELMHRIEKFTLEELLQIGTYCKLTSTETLKLVDAEYIKQKNIKPDATP